MGDWIVIGNAKDSRLCKTHVEAHNWPASRTWGGGGHNGEQILLCCDPPALTPFKIFDGECADGKEIRMYEGNGDNPGSPEERAVRCSNACRTKKKALSGSWTGFVAKGFVVVPTTGRCYCESADGFNCKLTSNTYDRYDWRS